MFSDPGRTGRTRPLMCADTASAHSTTKAPTRGNFGAQSHGFGTRCLRFAPRVARGGRKTRFWLLARLYQAGLLTRRVPTKGFRDASYIASSSPKLLGAGCFPFNFPDAAGRGTLRADPSAVSGYSDTYADLLHSVAGNYQYLNDSTGLVTSFTYATSTTATSPNCAPWS